MANIKKVLRIILYSLMLVGLLALVVELDMGQVSYHINLLDKGYLLAGMGFQLLTMVLLGLQWSSMVGMAGFRTSYRESFLLNAVGNVADALNPGLKLGGELFRYDQLKKRFNMDAEDSVLVVALQKLISISAFFILTFVSAVYLVFGPAREASLLFPLSLMLIGFGLVVSILAYMFLSERPVDRVLQGLRIKDETKNSIGSFFKNYHESLEAFKKDRAKLLSQFALAAFIWFFYGFKLYIICMAFGIKLNFFLIGAITYVSYMAGMIPLLPGGIGSFEGAMISLFALAGVEASLAVSISFVFRLVTFWFEFVFCVFVLVIEKIINKWKRCYGW